MITDEELDFTKSLARLVPTPRSAKRLTNIYRLIRASLPEEELAEFISVGHQPLLILLAAFIGHTEQATALGERLWGEAKYQPEQGWDQFLANSSGEAESRELASRLRSIKGQSPRVPIGDFAPWLPVVAGHVFHPWRAYED